MDPSSTVISVIALAVSLFALGWQLAQSRWDRPVVSVSGRRYQVTRAGESTAQDVRRVVVVNVGERPVTVLAAGWGISGDPDRPLVITGALTVAAAEFPLRLEPHDSRSWELSSGISDVERPIERPYARIVRRPTRRDRATDHLVIGSVNSGIGPPFGIDF